jgi:hypothetical protein
MSVYALLTLARTGKARRNRSWNCMAVIVIVIDVIVILILIVIAIVIVVVIVVLKCLISNPIVGIRQLIYLDIQNFINAMLCYDNREDRQVLTSRLMITSMT